MRLEGVALKSTFTTGTTMVCFLRIERYFRREQRTLTDLPISMAFRGFGQAPCTAIPPGMTLSPSHTTCLCRTWLTWIPNAVGAARQCHTLSTEYLRSR